MTAPPADAVRKVRLASSPSPTGRPGEPLLDPQGPAVVLGGADPLLGAVTPSASTLFGPRGAALVGDGEDGPLVVSDTGHHRLLGWRRRPTEDGQAADWVIGQPDFGSEGRNGGGAPGPATLNVPTGVARVGDGLAVADGWNNRVLLWRTVPTESHTPADVVLGQDDAHSIAPNRGDAVGDGEVGPTTLHWPFQVMEHEGRLLVADTGNRRILIWNQLPDRHGAPADVVLGQTSLTERSDNSGEAVGRGSFRWPHDLAVVGGDLVVTDAGNNRVLVFDGVPSHSGVPARAVLGQPDFDSVDHNRGAYWPDERSMNMPYAVAAWRDLLVVADTASSRLVGFAPPFLADQDRPATHLTGQVHFGLKGDNRWRLPERDSLCWPYGLDLHPGWAVV